MLKNAHHSCRICTNFPNVIFSELSDEEMIEFAGSKKSMLFKRGETLMKEGEEVEGVYCLKQGKCKLVINGYHGKEHIIRIASAGDIIGYRSLLSDELFSASVIALEDTWVCYISKIFFLKALRNNSELSFTLMKLAMHELGEAGKQITNLAQRTVRERLAHGLLQLEGKVGVDDDGFIDINLTREEIANLIGTATESAIRLISEFKADDLILVQGRRFKLLDRDKLLKMSEF